MSVFKSALLMITIALSVATANGQASESAHAAFYFLNGFQFFNPVNFNEKVSTSGYPILKSNFGSGFGGYGESKGWIFGGEGLYLQRSKSNDTKTSYSSGGFGYFFVGKKILNTRHWKIFPALGIGLGGVTNTLLTKVSSGTSFDDMLNNKPNAAVFEIGSVLVHSTMSIEYKFYGRYFAGVKGGYNFSLLGKTNWTAPGLDENLTIKDAFGGLYLSGQVGFYLH